MVKHLMPRTTRHLLHLPITKQQIEKYKQSIAHTLCYDPEIKDPVPRGTVFLTESETNEQGSNHAVMPFDNFENCERILDGKIQTRAQESAPNRVNSNLVIQEKNSTKAVSSCLDGMYNSWNESTNIHCWWCTYPFDTPPCFMPIVKESTSTQIQGCFCSHNCALSYASAHLTTTKWHVISQIRTMFELANPKTKLKPAPPRESLKIYGGHLTIEEFRRNFTEMTKSYWKIHAPYQLTRMYIQNMNQHDSQVLDNKLVLKRTKPVRHSHNSLEATMLMNS